MTRVGSVANIARGATELGRRYRWTARELALSKNTVNAVVRKERDNKEG